MVTVEMLEAALALLCALGVGSLLWLLFGLLVRPARGREPCGWPCGGRGSSAVRRGSWRSGCGRRSGRRTESPNKQGDPFEPPVLL